MESFSTCTRNAKCFHSSSFQACNAPQSFKDMSIVSCLMSSLFGKRNVKKFKRLYEIYAKLTAPDRCVQLFDRERYLITDTHTEVLDCISCVMVFFKGQTVQPGECTQTDKQTHKRMDGRYQTYYLPCFAVDNDQF